VEPAAGERDEVYEAVVNLVEARLKKARSQWVVDIRDQCRAADIPFFFKQWGGVRKKRAGRVLQDRTWDEMPRQMGMVDSQVRNCWKVTEEFSVASGRGNV